MGLLAVVFVALSAYVQGATPAGASAPDLRERVADGTVVARGADGVRLDSVVYVVEREGDVVWMTIAGADGSALRVPASTVSALRAALAYHLPDAPPAQSLAVGLDRGALYVGFERSLPLPALAAVLLLGAVLLVLVGGLVRERRRSSLLAVVSRHQVASREEERLRVAREIHDGPVQAIHAAAHALAANEAAAPVRDRIRSAAGDLRRIAAGLRPPALDQFGIVVALGDLAERTEEDHPGVRVRVDRRREDDAVWRGLHPDAALALFRVAQEAVQNAVVHGRALSVEVRLRAESGGVELAVVDAGGGFGAAVPSPAALARAGHFGLVGMHERARGLGGRLTVETTPRGTTVALRVPVERVASSSTPSP